MVLRSSNRNNGGLGDITGSTAEESSLAQGENQRNRTLGRRGLGFLAMIKLFFFVALGIALLSYILDLLALHPIHSLQGSSQTINSLIKQNIYDLQDKTSMASLARTNIIVVGGGLAGLSATVEALRQTSNAANAVRITLMDKESSTGGNSAKASSGINGALTRTQREKGISDSIEIFNKDTIKSGGGLSNETLVKKLVTDSTQAVSWLQDSFSLDLDVLAQLGGHSVPRTHRRPDINGKPQPVGWGIVSTLGKYLTEQAKQQDSRLSLLTSSRVTQLVEDKGRVVGVEYETVDSETNEVTKHKLLSDVVVLTTGGFAGEGKNPEFLKKYAPDLVGLPATNGPFATGDGLRLATALGAELIQMSEVQVHPTGFVRSTDPNSPTKFLAAEALRGEGGVLLNARGERFVNELDTRDHVTDIMIKECSSTETRAKYQDADESAEGAPKYASFLVLSQAAADSFGHGSLGFYQKMGLINKADNFDSLAAALRVDSSTLKKTFVEYDRSRAGKAKDAFGKTVFPQDMLNPEGAADAAYYWGVVTPSLHYTMGGLRFNEKTQVLRSDSTPILGLLAAGEVTGGLHGANRLGGNSLLECVVYGREAGRQASKVITELA